MGCAFVASILDTMLSIHAGKADVVLGLWYLSMHTTNLEKQPRGINARELGVALQLPDSWLWPPCPAPRLDGAIACFEVHPTPFSQSSLSGLVGCHS
ncbi:hypothetical protein B0H67DRAFT_367763 [Lasiosphaeris hirsuta]|uniref:Uncharacterized protein n=1 Tax=Lasiosphaeris hirsuta TaxID=260670 RepID=A0AA40DIN5_9PEZI|nr:hypothetical protein B0H67DRAFT_367763 [Lasiosphaeris hirsuta]